VAAIPAIDPVHRSHESRPTFAINREHHALLSFSVHHDVSWHDYPLGYSVIPVFTNALAAEGKISYFHGDSRIHNFYWVGTHWRDDALVASPANVQGCVTVHHSSCASGGSTGSKRR